MSNIDYLRTLTAEEFAHLFIKLRFDAAEESDWLEWMSMRYEQDKWEEILK